MTAEHTKFSTERLAFGLRTSDFSRHSEFGTRIPLVLLLLGALTWTASAAETASFQWARLLPGFLNEDQMLSSTMDREGNVIAAFRRADATGSAVWRSNRVMKVDTKAGDVLWSHRELPMVLALGEKPDGSLMALGTLAYFNDSGGVSLGGQQSYFSARGLTTQGTGGGYVARLNPQTGAIESIMHIGKSMYVMPNRLAVMADGGFVACGWYLREAAQFGDLILPRPGTTTLRNLFVARFGPDGATRWAYAFESTQPYAFPSGVAIDPAGNVVFSASGTGSFLGRKMTDASFAAKLTPDGDVLWIKENFPGSRLVLDRDGNFYFPNQAKYSPEGALIWNRQPGLWQVAVDGAGNYVGAGSFRITDNYDGTLATGKVSIGDITLETEVEAEMFIVKYNTAGQLLWVARSEGLQPAYRPFGWDVGYQSTWVSPTAIYTHPERGILIAGTLAGQAMFGETLLEGPYRKDFNPETGFFIAKMAEPNPGAGTPAVKIVRTSRGIALSWPADSAGFVLESTPSLSSPTWTEVSFAPQTAGNESVVEITPELQPGFFRLRKR